MSDSSREVNRQGIPRSSESCMMASTRARWLPLPIGVGVDALPVKMGEKGCAVSGEENVLLSPQVEVGKGVFAAPIGAVSENGLIGFLIRQADAVKIQHEKGTVLVG